MTASAMLKKHIGGLIHALNETIGEKNKRRSNIVDVDSERYVSPYCEYLNYS
jgi:hypothetical protein